MEPLPANRNVIYNLEGIILISMFGITGVIAGIIMIIVGGILVFFFPAASTYQPRDFSVLVVVIGFILIILGAVMAFV
jgi:uncharacterized membrane protein HdeD (DUF308 family)